MCALTHSTQPRLPKQDRLVPIAIVGGPGEGFFRPILTISIQLHQWLDDGQACWRYGTADKSGCDGVECRRRLNDVRLPVPDPAGDPAQRHEHTGCLVVGTRSHRSAAGPARGESCTRGRRSDRHIVGHDPGVGQSDIAENIKVDGAAFCARRLLALCIDQARLFDPTPVVCHPLRSLRAF